MKKNYKVLILLLISFPAFFAGATVQTVQVSDYQFSPANIAVSVGDTISWMWVNGSHTTTSTSVPPNAESWNMPVNQIYTVATYVIKEAGTYLYQCNFHYAMGMTGSINATVTGISTENKNSQVNILGNIIHNELKIETHLQSGSMLSIRLIDLTGKLVRTFSSASEMTGNTQIFQVADLPRGLYIVQLAAGDLNLTRRVILQ